MSHETLHTGDLTLIQRFEAAWYRHPSPVLDDYLPPASDSQYLATLERLVGIDLRCRLARASSAVEAQEIVLEDYLARFEVLNTPHVMRRLALDEVKARRDSGYQSNDSECARRSPGRGQEANADHPTDPAATRLVAVGTLIGPYKLIKKLGEGGFGVVYLAEQVRPVKRHVALKVIKPGMDSAAVVARFDAERQALALMDHESIARVLDAGTTENGLPFFVMECVDGLPITEYCDAHRLPTKQRLDLFIQVCGAIQHAHQKGVIHRDIKPSNVLVASKQGRPVPKVIDFGIAKALEQPLTKQTLCTQYGQVVGTPHYMSPEQAAGHIRDVDTRSDVYCLGVLLYELLTGTTPIPLARFREAAIDEVLRLIREGEHVRPSTRISQSGAALSRISENRQAQPRRLSTLVRGDLDWIVMKALDKDRARRYDSASAFADDLRRHLDDEPVVAGPPSTAYRFRKFAKKYRATILTSSAVAALLVAATIASTVFFLRANAARAAEASAKRLAIRQAEVATAVTDFLTEDVLDQANPNSTPDRDIKLRTVLDRAAEKIESRFANQPTVESAVHLTIGNSYLGLGEYEAAEKHLQASVDLRERLLGPDQADTLRSRASLAAIYYSQGRLAEAKPIFEEVLEWREMQLGPQHEETISSMNDLATILATEGEYAAAEPLFLRAVHLARESSGAESHLTNMITLHLTDLYQIQGRYEEAEPLLRESVKALEKHAGQDHALAIQSLNHLAGLLLRKGQLADSEALFNQAILRSERVYGAEHPTTLEMLSDRCVLYDMQGRIEESTKQSRTVLEGRRKALGPDHHDTITAMNNLATALFRKGEYENCSEVFEEALEACQRVRGSQHPFVAQIANNLAMAYQKLGRYEQAEFYANQAIQLRERILGADHPETLVSLNNIATLYHDMGRKVESRDILLDVLSRHERVVGTDHPDTLALKYNLAHLHTALGDHEDAEALFQEVLVARQRLFGKENPDTVIVYNGLVDLYINQERYEEALTLSIKAAELTNRVLGERNLYTLIALNNRALAHHKMNDYEQALAQFKEAIYRQSDALGEDQVLTMRTKDNLAQLYFEIQRFEEAEALWLDAYRRLEAGKLPIPGAQRGHLMRSAAERLARLYAGWGRAKQAELWRAHSVAND